MADADSAQPTLRHTQGTGAAHLGTKIADQISKVQGKASDKAPEGSKLDPNHKEPAGGYDDTKYPQVPPGYTLKFTFHSAENLPFADINTMSADPYIMAVLKTDLEKRHKQDPELRKRTPTIHTNTNPVWNDEWIVANVPASGFHLKCRLYDEDPADHDDRLGNVHVQVNAIDDSWKGIKEQKFDIKKRMGSKRAYTLRGAAALFSKKVRMDGHVTISVENLGKTKDENGGHMYTIGPLSWTRHYSPLIGRIAGTIATNVDVGDGDGKKKATQKYNFQAVQMQFQGPVPEDLYHRYVEFKPFVNGMFESHSLRGKLLNRALHHQHARIYNYDQTTVHGKYEKPCQEMTKQFLSLVDWDRGGKIYTYVLSLDGLFRFTQTGKEFGIDLLSKHSMHSNVSIYIAFSGEFFIRRIKHPHKERDTTPDPPDGVLPPAEEPEKKDQELMSPVAKHEHKKSDEPERGRQQSQQIPAGGHRDPSQEMNKDPSVYELIIDNDSGTYRPNAKTLPDLKKYLEENLVGLKVSTLDCNGDKERMDKLKNQQREFKKNQGTKMTYLQNSSQSSISSSEEEVLDDRAQGRDHEHKYKKEMKKLERHAKGGKGRGARHSAEYGDVSSSSSASEDEKKSRSAAHQSQGGQTTLPMRDGNPQGAQTQHAADMQVQSQGLATGVPQVR